MRTEPRSREELERLRDQEALAAEAMLYGTGLWEPHYAGSMSAASAHASLALPWQARIEWEYGVGS